MTPEYLAGFFDGEGYVGVQVPGGKASSIQTIVVQKDTEILHDIQSVYGGVVSKRSTGGTSSWYATGYKALPFLKSILPHLRYKKPQVEIAIEYQETLTGHGKGPEVQAMKEQVRNRLSEMKGGASSDS